MDFFFYFRQNKAAIIGSSVVLFFVLLAVFAPIIAPYEPNKIIDGAVNIPPIWSEGANSKYFLGTDDLGRDMFSRLIYGARFSLLIGLMVVVFSVCLGTIIGTLAGYYGGIVDTIVMRLVDIMMAIPSILLAIFVVVILTPGLVSTIIAVGVVALPQVIRLVRALVLAERKKTYVMASKSFGASSLRQAFLNIFPNCVAPIIVQASLGFSDGILNAAALGFLGLGAQPPTPEWGTMLADARAYIETAPWLVTLPGICILLVVLAFNLLGDGLRDVLDPRMRK